MVVTRSARVSLVGTLGVLLNIGPAANCLVLSLLQEQWLRDPAVAQTLAAQDQTHVELCRLQPSSHSPGTTHAERLEGSPGTAWV